GQRRVVAVRQAGAVLLVGQEHVPQARAACLRLQLLHHRRLVVRVAGVVQLLLVDALGRVDVLVHEGAETLLELKTALARLEVHRSSSLAAGSIRSSRMSSEGVSYRAAGVDSRPRPRGS